MVHIQPDGRANIATIVAFIVLDSLAVILRIISKGKTKNRYSSDDWWILCALLFFFGWAGLKLYCVAGIAGTLSASSLQDPLQIEEALKILWIAELFFPLTITPIKISILCFYRMIFSTPNYRRATYYLSAICGLWLFSGFWVTIFQCRPVRAVYDRKLAASAHCVAFGQFAFVHELINALTDLCILALPIFVIRKLQMPTRQKLQIMSIFLLGGFVFITCILRIVYLYNPRDPNKVPSYSRATFWCTMEIGVALICACLPTYRPLLPKSMGVSDIFKSWYSSLLNITQSRTGSTSSDIPKAQVSNYSRFDSNRDDTMGEEHFNKAVGVSDIDVQFSKTGAYPLSTISVVRRFDAV